ncbi:MAG: hypothetical protein FD133_1920 [Erysipelotrichaceae bacterium]|nr:MAG: hypothetical protein FD133_1920 [Erysipelotrichaceae bacterium]
MRHFLVLCTQHDHKLFEMIYTNLVLVTFYAQKIPRFAYVKRGTKYYEFHTKSFYRIRLFKTY